VRTVRLPKPFGPGEVERVIATAQASRPDVAAAMVLLLESGLRIAEACSITSEEARSWPEPPWWCRRRTCRRHSWSTAIVGKGDRERRIALTPAALRASRTLLGVTTNGTLIPWTDRGVRYLFERVGAQVGIHVHPHRFRHQFAQEMIDAGVPVELVADMMGHSTTEITRLYFGASHTRQLEAMRVRHRRRLRPSARLSLLR